MSLCMRSSEQYSNSNSREKLLETIFFEAAWRRKLFQMKVFGAAIDSEKCSSKSELSSRFFGHLKMFRVDRRFLRHRLAEIQIGSHGYKRMPAA